VQIRIGYPYGFATIRTARNIAQVISDDLNDGPIQQKFPSNIERCCKEELASDVGICDNSFCRLTDNSFQHCPVLDRNPSRVSLSFKFKLGLGEGNSAPGLKRRAALAAA
jgi:hypothetical protein